MRFIEVLAQALCAAEVVVKRPAIITPGGEVGLARGELGQVGAVQLASTESRETALVIKADFAEVWVMLRTDNRFVNFALRALRETNVSMPDNERDPTMKSERFNAMGGNGLPTRVLTDR